MDLLPNNTAKQAGKTRLLIMSVGSLVASNLLEALEAIGRDRFFVIGTNSECEALNNYACDVVYRVPPAASGERYREALTAIGVTEQPELWIPARDDDVLELARLTAQQNHSGNSLVGSVEASEIICDKWLSYCFAIDHGLKVAPTAKTFEAAATLAQRHGFPLIVKPRRGFGSVGARFVTSLAQLERAMAGNDCVAQRVISPAANWAELLPDPDAGWPLWYSYVDPGQYACQWTVAPEGHAVKIGATLSTMICGRAERSVRVEDAALSETTGAYARALAAAGWRGPLNVQCRRDGNGDFLMFELAGRFAGGLGARELLGLHETETVLATIFPDRFSPSDSAQNDLALTLKQPRTVGIDRQALALLSAQGVWRRSC